MAQCHIYVSRFSVLISPAPQICGADFSAYLSSAPYMWRVTDPNPYTCCVESIKCCHPTIGCSSRLPSSIKYSCWNKWENLHNLLWSGFFYRKLPNTIVGRNGSRIVVLLPKIELSIQLTTNNICYRLHLVPPSVPPPAYRDSAGMHYGTRKTLSWERVYKPPF